MEWQTVDVPAHINGALWVKMIEVIRNNATGETREREGEMLMHEGETKPSAYIWEEGSYSCDCNRCLLFGYAGGEELESGCGVGAYSVQLKNAKTGRVFYSEFD